MRATQSDGSPAGARPERWPHPPRQLVLGNLHQMRRGSMWQTLIGLAADSPGLMGMRMGWQEIAFVVRAHVAAEVCDDARFVKSTQGAVAMLDRLAPNGLFTAPTDSREHELARSVLAPAFSARARRAYFAGMRQVAGEAVRRWETRGGEPIEVSEEMTRLALEMIARVGFGMPLGQLEEGRPHPFVASLKTSLIRALSDSRALLLTPSPLRPPLRKFLAWRAAPQAMPLVTMVDELIEARRGMLAVGQGARDDLLGLMLTSQDRAGGQRLGDEAIRAQVMTFLVAGHETTAALLAFCLHLLARHRSVLDAVHAEIDAVLPGARPIEEEDLERLELIGRVIKESLRLWPTAPAFTVNARQDVVLAGRWRIGKGQRVVMALPCLHRDPTVWDEPERFDPQRFTPEREAALPQAAYKPWGHGVRSCLGRRFAETEATIALAVLLQRFSIEDARPDEPLRLEETLTIRPAGMRLVLTRRTQRKPAESQERAGAQPASAQPSGCPFAAGRAMRSDD